MRLHFISGLPRSGSTLLAALLRQNPRFRAGMTSPLSRIVTRMQECVSRGREGSVFITEAQKRALLLGLFASYYDADFDEGIVVFDTSRDWCAKLPLLADLVPGAKVVCCVRDIPWILDSVERLIQANPTELSGIFGFRGFGTVYSRIRGLTGPEGMVSHALDALREAFYGPHADRLILIDYEALARDPESVMSTLYNFLGQPFFAHDFNDVHYEAEDFDLPLGTPGLHTVNGPVVWRERETVLPPDLFMQFAKASFWLDPDLNRRGVPVLTARSIRG